MAETSVVVDHKRLTVFIADALGAMKMPRERAAVTAELMVRTDLRGVDSHGIDMLPRYHELWQEGFVVMDTDAVLEKDSMATGLYDGAKGLGHWVSSLAMKLALDKARTYGIGIVTVRNSGHFGAAANYSMMALEHDMIGVATTNSAFIAMVPTFGRAPKLSTNPISFAAPAGRHAPFVLDMATTTVAFGKLRIASRWGKPIPSGWALDDEGEPTTDPDVAMKHRLQTPVGGTRELGSHKGYGLAAWWTSSPASCPAPSTATSFSAPTAPSAGCRTPVTASSPSTPRAFGPSPTSSGTWTTSSTRSRRRRPSRGRRASTSRGSRRPSARRGGGARASRSRRD